MHAIDTYNSNAHWSQFKPNLKGFLVGNGLTSYQWDCIPAFLDMSPYHNLLDDDLYSKLKASCTWRDLMVKASPLGDAACDLYFDEWMDKIAHLNIYDIYGRCNLGAEREIRGDERDRVGYTQWLGKHLGLSPVGKGLPQCEQGRGIEKYFNREDVRRALHIEDDGQPWEMCSSSLNYT